MSLTLAAALLPVFQLPQHSVERHGDLGTWYRSSHYIELREEDETLPQLERIGDMPSGFRTARTSRPAVVTFGAYTSVQVNVDAKGMNILGDAANESSLSMDPTNSNRMIVGWRQFDSVKSNFRQAGNAWTADGGATWHNNKVLTPGTFRSDPVLDVNASGKFFYNSLQETFFDDIFGSADHGATWKFQGPATGGDKQWMTVDRTKGIGAGNMYQCWSTAGNNYGGRQFSRSTDGGLTWSDPVNIPGSPVWGTLDVATNGDVYLCGLASGFEFARSHNAQNRAVVPTFDLVSQVNLGGALSYGAFINPVGLSGQTWIAVDKSTGPFKGSIYMLASVAVDTTNPSQVNIARSRDGGVTWSSPVTINDDLSGTGAFHWFGSMAVAPNGRIDAMWYDNRPLPKNSVSALYYSHSSDGGVTWSKNIELSPRFSPSIGYPQQNKMGDYMTVVSTNTGPNVAYAATFNKEEDIWFLKVPALLDHFFSPTNASNSIGTIVSGSFKDLGGIDNRSIVQQSSFVSGTGTTTSLVVDGLPPRLPITSVLGVKIHLTSLVAATGNLTIYNWKTAKFEPLQSFSLVPKIAVDLVGRLGADPGNYFDATGKVRVGISTVVPSGKTGTSYQVQFDQVQFQLG